MEHLINFLAKYKETIDFVVLAFTVLLQWPVFFIDRLAEEELLKDELNIPESLTSDNMILVTFGLLGGFALANKLIDKAIEVYGIKHSLSVLGFTFLSLAILFYLFIAYLFVSLTAYAIILQTRAKKIRAGITTESKNSKV